MKQEYKEMVRKMYYESLPLWENDVRYNGQINWNKSVGEFVDFEYENIKGRVQIIGYDGKNLYIKYKDKEPFKTNTGNFKKCQLGKLLGKITNEFKIEIGSHFKDDKRDLIIINREYREYVDCRKTKKTYNKRWYKYKCNKCGYEGWVIEHSILKHGTGCPVCCKQSKIVIEGINDIPTTAPWMIKFFQGGYDEAKLYTKSSGLKITPICPDCGKIKTKSMYVYTIYKTKSIGCTCGDGFSYGHKYIHSLLTQLNLDFEDNKTFDWCKFQSYKNINKQIRGQYDFVLENMKLIIEVDGDFHRNDNRMNGQTKEESKYLDDMKDILAEQHEYKVVRISDEDNIKDNILKSELVNILNLNNVNWLEMEEFALNNLCKLTCEIKNNKPDIFTKEISDITKLNKITIIKYLKKGTKLGWCKYDPKEEQRKSGRKSGKIAAKSVEMFKDGISLGVFEGATELARQSEKLFGIKLHQTSISSVCLGKRKAHNGYTFRYVYRINN